MYIFISCLSSSFPIDGGGCECDAVGDQECIRYHLVCNIIDMKSDKNQLSKNQTDFK